MHNHYHCFVCQEGFEAKLDEFIAVSFTVSPNVRDITYHHPDRLSPREHFFDYYGLEEGHIADGTPFVKVQGLVTKAMSHLPPDETIEMTVEAEDGSVIGVSHEGGAAFVYSIEGQSTGEDQRFAIEFGEPVYKYSIRKVAPGRARTVGARPTVAGGDLERGCSQLSAGQLARCMRAVTTGN